MTHSDLHRIYHQPFFSLLKQARAFGVTPDHGHAQAFHTALGCAGLCRHGGMNEPGLQRRERVRPGERRDRRRRRFETARDDESDP